MKIRHFCIFHIQRSLLKAFYIEMSTRCIEFYIVLNFIYDFWFFTSNKKWNLMLKFFHSKSKISTFNNDLIFIKIWSFHKSFSFNVSHQNTSTPSENHPNFINFFPHKISFRTSISPLILIFFSNVRKCNKNLQKQTQKNRKHKT